MEKRIFVLVFVMLSTIGANAQTESGYLGQLVGVWGSDFGREEVGDGCADYIQVFRDGYIRIQCGDERNIYAAEGFFSADGRNIAVTLPEDCPTFDLPVPNSGKISIPYRISQSKDGKSPFLTVTLGGKKFTLEKVGSYNLSVPEWKEREEYLYELNASWKDGENYASIENSRIDFSVENKSGDSYSVIGLFTADGKNLYITPLNFHSSDGRFDGKDLISVPYSISERSDGHVLTLMIAGKTFALPRAEIRDLPQRRQTELNGIWTASRSLVGENDWNITVQFLEESFLATAESRGHRISFLGDTFYEDGLLFINETDKAESVAYDADFSDGVLSAEGRFFESPADYAAFHELPEYMFLGCGGKTSGGICAYSLKNGVLTLEKYGKKLELRKKN